MDQANDVGAKSRQFAADHELDGFTGLNPQMVGVSDDAALDQVLRDLLTDAHVRPLDRRGSNGTARRLRWRLRGLRGEAAGLRRNAASRTGRADGFQEVAAANFWLLRRLGGGRSNAIEFVVMRRHGSLLEVVRSAIAKCAGSSATSMPPCLGDPS